GVLGSSAGAAAGSGTDHHRHVYLAAEHEVHLGSLVDDLVVADGHEVGEHQLHDGTHAGDSSTDAAAHEGGLRDGGIDDTVLTELLHHALGHAEGAAVNAN